MNANEWTEIILGRLRFTVFMDQGTGQESQCPSLFWQWPELKLRWWTQTLPQVKKKHLSKCVLVITLSTLNYPVNTQMPVKTLPSRYYRYSTGNSTGWNGAGIPSVFLRRVTIDTMLSLLIILFVLYLSCLWCNKQWDLDEIRWTWGQTSLLPPPGLDLPMKGLESTCYRHHAVSVDHPLCSLSVLSLM